MDNKETIKEERAQSAIRAVLRNEFTWIIFIIGLVYGTVSTIILPLQELQINMKQMQVTLLELNSNNKNILLAKQELDTRLSILETEVRPLLK